MQMIIKIVIQTYYVIALKNYIVYTYTVDMLVF